MSAFIFSPYLSKIHDPIASSANHTNIGQMQYKIQPRGFFPFAINRHPLGAEEHCLPPALLLYINSPIRFGHLVTRTAAFDKKNTS